MVKTHSNRFADDDVIEIRTRFSLAFGHTFGLQTAEIVLPSGFVVVVVVVGRRCWIFASRVLTVRLFGVS